MKRCTLPKRAFTLVELLAMIAIISVVAAITFPTIAHVREEGRRATCSSNERQISCAVLLYSQDYDDRLPPWDAAYTTSPPTGDIPTKWWKSAIVPYIRLGFVSADLHGKQHIKEFGVWRCPSADRYLDGLDWLGGHPPPTIPTTASYGMSMFLAYDHFGLTPLSPSTRYYRGLPLASIVTPSATIMIGDGGQSGRIGSPISHHWRDDAKLFENEKAQNWERRDIHDGGANYAFCDSHVKWLRADRAYPEDAIGARSAARRYFAATLDDHTELDRSGH